MWNLYNLNLRNLVLINYLKHEYKNGELWAKNGEIGLLGYFMQSEIVHKGSIFITCLQVVSFDCLFWETTFSASFFYCFFIFMLEC